MNDLRILLPTISIPINLAMLILALKLLDKFRGGKIAQGWFWLAMACICWVIGNFIFFTRYLLQLYWLIIFGATFHMIAGILVCVAFIKVLKL